MDTFLIALWHYNFFQILEDYLQDNKYVRKITTLRGLENLGELQTRNS